MFCSSEKAREIILKIKERGFTQASMGGSIFLSYRKGGYKDEAYRINFLDQGIMRLMVPEYVRKKLKASDDWFFIEYYQLGKWRKWNELDDQFEHYLEEQRILGKEND